MMTGKERLLSIYQGKSPDRPAVRLWGLMPGQKLLHPAYEPVYRAAMEHTDLILDARSAFDIHWGVHRDDMLEVNTVRVNDEWVDIETVAHTPAGIMKGTYRESTLGNPGYIREHMLKEPEDIRKVLSIPYEPFTFSAAEYLEKERSAGDNGIVVFILDHAFYGLHRLAGSENLAVWGIDNRDILLEAVHAFVERIKGQILEVIKAGLRPVFGWVGPEVCIPPLMRMKDFEDFIFNVDKPLIDLIHEAGGYVWVHCHGRMRSVLERFLAMGVDVMNPIEPPPMGDITLEDAFTLTEDRMGLEGNIEIHDLMSASGEQLEQIISEAIGVGGNGRRFILCPTSGYMEYPDPPKRLIDNLLIYIQEGVRYAKEYES